MLNNIFTESITNTVNAALANPKTIKKRNNIDRISRIIAHSLANLEKQCIKSYTMEGRSLQSVY